MSSHTEPHVKDVAASYGLQVAPTLLRSTAER